MRRRRQEGDHAFSPDGAAERPDAKQPGPSEDDHLTANPIDAVELITGARLGHVATRPSACVALEEGPGFVGEVDVLRRREARIVRARP
jgi:hypothetical protein